MIVRKTSMKEKAKLAPYKEVKRIDFLQAGFKLFSERSIEDVTLNDVANASNYGVATLYRYFKKKPGFVVAVAGWRWSQFYEENQKRRPNVNFKGMTAAQIFDFYLDSFIELYKNHKDLLRFNHYFEIYIQSEDIDDETIKPYKTIIENLKKQFHLIYEKAKEDKSLRTEIPEDKIFSTTLHLMFAAVTRYAAGLFYTSESSFDDLGELLVLKEMLLNRFTL